MTLLFDLENVVNKRTMSGSNHFEITEWRSRASGVRRAGGSGEGDAGEGSKESRTGGRPHKEIQEPLQLGVQSICIQSNLGRLMCNKRISPKAFGVLGDGIACNHSKGCSKTVYIDKQMGYLGEGPVH